MSTLDVEGSVVANPKRFKMRIEERPSPLSLDVSCGVFSCIASRMIEAI